MTADLAYGTDVWRFAKTLDPEGRKALFAALRECAESDDWKPLPFPFKPGCYESRKGGFYFVSVILSDTKQRLIVKIGRPASDFVL